MMKPTPSKNPVLVASDKVDDANEILSQLRPHFVNVHSSIQPERAVQDFAQFKPDVLVLAFNSLEKAQRYHLGLNRLGQSPNPHRTVLLCTKDEVREAFDLCKQSYFDDYVLYWPQTFDGHRLAMSIWIACREMTALRPKSPGNGELLAHARHLSELEQTLDRELAEGEQRSAAAGACLRQAERELDGAIDAFSDRLTQGGAAAMVEGKNTVGLAREIDQLKKQQLAQTTRLGATGVEPVNAWIHNLKSQVAPALAGTRPLTEMVRKIRPLVMVVEDDELAQKLVVRTLDPAAYEVLLIGNGPEALRQLRRVHPHVIMMDIRLPGMDGIALTKHLKATLPLAGIPIIMMSGDSRRETLIASLEAGAAAFLVKPFTREALMARLEKVLPR